MDQIFIRGIELPGSVRGATIKLEDDFIIFINTCLSPAVRQAAALHELRHIKKNHFYNQDPVVINEMEAQS